MKAKKERVPKCCAATCISMKKDNKDGITLFSFPTEDEARCREWIRNTNLQVSRKKSTISLVSYHLCSRHFENNQFLDDGKNTLIKNAIPTIFHVDIVSGPSSKDSERDGGGESKEDDHPGDDKARNMPINQRKKNKRLMKSHSNGDSQDNEESENADQEMERDKLNQKSSNTHCQWCSAINCSNNRFKRPELSFFRFPADPERCKKWIMNSQRFDMKDKSSKTLSRGSHICSEHFEEHCIIRNGDFKSRRRLHKWAVPTIFNFSPSTSQKNGRKPTPTFPSHTREEGRLGRARRNPSASTGSGRNKSHAEDSAERRGTRSLKRKHATIVKHELKDDDVESNAKKLSVKELREENLSLSDQLYRLTESRVHTMRRIFELEAQMNGLKEYSRIDVQLLSRALNTDKHKDAEQEFERLKSVINLLAHKEEPEEDEVSNGSVE